MSELKQELKELIIETLDLEDITPNEIVDDAPLFIDGLGLDSIDALEIGVALQKKYNIKMTSDSENLKEHFRSIEALAKYISYTLEQSGN